MKRESQLRESIVVIALMIVAVVGGLSYEKITHAHAEAFDNKNTNLNKADPKNDPKKNDPTKRPKNPIIPNDTPPSREPVNGPEVNSTTASLETIKSNLKTLEGQSIKRDDLWPLDIFVNPIGLSLIIL